MVSIIKTNMKILYFYIIALISFFLYSCNGSKTYKEDANSLSLNNSITSSPNIYNYDEENILEENEAENDECIDDEIDIDDLEYKLKFDYANTINGYKVTIAIRNTREYIEDYSCWAYISLERENKTFTILHPTFIISQSDFNKLSTGKIKALKYKIPHTSQYKDNELGHFKDVPFAFFDIDFDGEKELLLRHPSIGQRGSNGYNAYKIPQNEDKDFEEVTLYYSIRKAHDFPILDDYTEVDFKNKNIIIRNIGGYDDYSAEIYSVNDGQLKRIN